MGDVLGWNVEDATKEVVRIGLVPDVEMVESDVYEENTVISTSIPEGTEVEVNTAVTLTVSAGIGAIDVPDVAGLTYEEAYNRITMEGFLVNRTENYSATVEKGKVISQSPLGEEPAPKGSTINLNVSLGVENNKIVMPNLIGKELIEAEEWIYENGMILKTVGEVYSDTVAKDLICYQNYSEGTFLESGSIIELNVSLGKSNATYKCNAIIEAPTASEAPDYSSGSEVHISMIADSGKVLLDMSTSTFPQAVNIQGIDSQWGTITLTYTATVNGVAESKSIERRIEFAQE